MVNEEESGVRRLLAYMDSLEGQRRTYALLVCFGACIILSVYVVKPLYIAHNSVEFGKVMEARVVLQQIMLAIHAEMGLPPKHDDLLTVATFYYGLVGLDEASRRDLRITLADLVGKVRERYQALVKARKLTPIPTKINVRTMEVTPREAGEPDMVVGFFRLWYAVLSGLFRDSCVETSDKGVVACREESRWDCSGALINCTVFPNVALGTSLIAPVGSRMEEAGAGSPGGNGVGSADGRSKRASLADPTDETPGDFGVRVVYEKLDGQIRRKHVRFDLKVLVGHEYDALGTYGKGRYYFAQEESDINCYEAKGNAECGTSVIMVCEDTGEASAAIGRNQMDCMEEVGILERLIKLEARLRED